MHLTGLHLIDVHLAGMHLICAHLAGVHPKGIHLLQHVSLAGVYLTGVRP